MKAIKKHFVNVLVFILFFSNSACAQQKKVTYVGDGWAKNSINTVIFRKNSLTSKEGVQFISYYNPEGQLVLGKRNIGEKEWQTNITQYKGNVQDAHNSASIELDEAGYLHVSWDHHNSPLRYAKSTSPGSLELSDEMSMIGSKENVVSYPEFYRLPNGDLLFFYRDGGSGNGNLIINKYSTSDGQWKRLQDNLIDGEGERNAYWQACVSTNGTIHITWVWRESPDVASNHDMSYAKSMDGGVSWQKSDGTKYQLPITQSTAEIIHEIPQKSELINQTSMTTDESGNPYIVSYWKTGGSEIPQFQIIYQSDDQWKLVNTEIRSKPFSLSGMGTKQIPISRPQIVVSKDKVYVIFRDAERGSRVSIASNSISLEEEWIIKDYSEGGYDSWEPTLDPHLWTTHKTVSLLLQKNIQIDGEGLSERSSAPIQVLDIDLK